MCWKTRFLCGIIYKKGAFKALGGVLSTRMKVNLFRMFSFVVRISKKFGGSVKRNLGWIAVGLVFRFYKPGNLGEE